VGGSGRLWEALGVGFGRLWEALEGSSGVLWGALGGCGRQWDALGSSGRLWEALGCCGRHWDALGSSGGLWEALGGSGRLWEVLGSKHAGWSGDYRENRRSADENSEHSELRPPPEIFRMFRIFVGEAAVHAAIAGPSALVGGGGGGTGEILNILNFVGGKRCSECSEFRSWSCGFRGSRNSICSVTQPAAGFLHNQGRRGESLAHVTPPTSHRPLEVESETL